MSKAVKIIGFAPDLDPSTPGVLTSTDALLANSRGFFVPQPASVAQGTLAAKCFGGYAATYLDSSIRYFAGTGTHLYELSSGSWSEVDGSTTFTGSTNPWRFTVFGNDCIAVNGADTPVVAGKTGNFATVSGSPPTARLVQSIANGFVMMANITSSPNESSWPSFADRYWTCAQYDDTNWTPSTSTLCSTGRIIDEAGPITAIRTIGQNLNFAVYKQHATYMAQFVGLPDIWAFMSRNERIGAWSQESIVDIGNIHVFPAYDDFYMFNGISVTPLKSPIRKWFFNKVNLSDLDAGTANIYGVFDRIHDLAYWFFPTTSTSCDTWVAWNTQSNLWTTGSISIEAVMWPEYNGTTLPSVGYFDTSHKLQTLSGSANSAATFTTGDMGSHDQFTRITRLEPKFATFPTYPRDITVTGYTKVQLGGTATTTNSGIQMDAQGYVNLRQNARWHSFQFTLGSDCEVIGIGFEGTPYGKR